MRKFYFVLLIAALICSCLFACKDSENSQNPSESSSETVVSSSLAGESQNQTSSQPIINPEPDYSEDLGISEYPDLELGDNENENDDRWWESSSADDLEQEDQEQNQDQGE